MKREAALERIFLAIEGGRGVAYLCDDDDRCKTATDEADAYVRQRGLATTRPFVWCINVRDEPLFIAYRVDEIVGERRSVVVCDNEAVAETQWAHNVRLARRRTT